jgi:hypothetical protein
LIHAISRPENKEAQLLPIAPGTQLPVIYITAHLGGDGKFSQFRRLAMLLWSLGV